jgi:FKBP-type peptidyl-prolyl cis-trans isomerase 2
MSEKENLEILKEEEEEVTEKEGADVSVEENNELDAEEEAEEEEAEEEEAEEEEAEEEEIYYEDAINKGDFIYLEMTGKAVETGDVFDTTNDEIAKESGIFNEDRSYGPRLVIVGDGFVLNGLDQKLPGKKLDEEAEIEIPPEEAFGLRNTELVQMIPYRILRSKGINPSVGAELEIDGRPAVIRSIGAGRVQVDYNHPLSGRKLVYNIKITEHITDDNAKIRALINRRFIRIDADLFKLRKTKKKLRIRIPDQIFFNENIQIAKRGLALDILRYFENFEEIEYQETVKRT